MRFFNRSRIDRAVAAFTRSYALLEARLLMGRWRLATITVDELVGKDVEIEAPILDDICLPPFYGWDDHDDLTPLMKIVRVRNPQVVVEFGTAHGNLTANVCRQSQRSRVYTVNALETDMSGRVGSSRLGREEIGRVYRAHGFTARVIQILTNTLCLDLTEYFAAPVVDLAVIDACHDTGYVLNDFFKVLPYIKPGGMVLLHDTHPSMSGHLLGSYLACMRLCRRGYRIDHIKDTWWAVWRNDPNGEPCIARERL